MTDISTTDENLLFCSFCGKNQNEVKKLIAGPSVYICDECVSLCNDIIKEDLESKEAENSETKKLPSPEEINSFLNDYVIGQEDAKKTLSVAVYNHYKKLQNMDVDAEVVSKGPRLDVRRANVDDGDAVVRGERRRR